MNTSHEKKLAEVQEAINTLKGTITDPKKLKAIAVAEAVINAATNIVRDVSRAYPAKRPFRKIDRRPKKRLLKSRAKANMLIGPRLAALEIQKIVSMPTLMPDYPSGGIAIIGETGPELLIAPSGESFKANVLPSPNIS